MKNIEKFIIFSFSIFGTYYLIKWLFNSFDVPTPELELVHFFWLIWWGGFLYLSILVKGKTND